MLSALPRRNTAIAAATGASLIAHFDDDVIYGPSYLATMATALGSAALVKLSAWFVIDIGTDSTIQCAHFDGRKPLPPPLEQSRARMVRGSGWNLMYAVQAHMQAPFVDARFAVLLIWILGLQCY